MKKVLLVDDDLVFNLLSRKTLEKLGLADEVQTALNGTEALKLLNKYLKGSQSMPDVILLDLNMPIMDGFQFIDEFAKMGQEVTGNCKVVMLTSSVDDQDLINGYGLGANSYLRKPVDFEKFVRAIQQLEKTQAIRARHAVA